MQKVEQVCGTFIFECESWSWSRTVVDNIQRWETKMQVQKGGLWDGHVTKGLSVVLVTLVCVSCGEGHVGGMSRKV